MASYQTPRRWEDRVRWLAETLHGRSRWRLSVLLLGALFAGGRRVVASWTGRTPSGPSYSHWCSSQ